LIVSRDIFFSKPTKGRPPHKIEKIIALQIFVARLLKWDSEQSTDDFQTVALIGRLIFLTFRYSCRWAFNQPETVAWLLMMKLRTFVRFYSSAETIVDISICRLSRASCKGSGV